MCLIWWLKLNWTPNLELYVVRCGSKDGYQNDICLKEIDACPKHDNTINEHKNLHFDDE